MPTIVGPSSTETALQLRTISEAAVCGTERFGKVIMATLNRVPIITISANGHAVTLVLDTGAERTVLTPDVAERIGAQRPSIEFQRQVRGITGDLGSREVELRSFAAGDVPLPWHRVLVAPVTTAKIFPTGLDGFLGADVLSDFDIDLDVPGHEVGLYRKQTCPTAAPDWAGRYSTIDTGISRGERLFFPVQLDGRRLTAVIDTGSQVAVLATGSAAALGITEPTLSRDPTLSMRGVTGGSLDSRFHQFGKLEVGTIVVRNPKIAVADLKLSEADLLLGIDFMSSRRVWLSYGSRRIFLR
ncbi:MAG: retropepsin-like domain-containing protein [Deltaproteobacteria bacterium]|nr:retropepsin-like domain-containing protein [Deltaproteobacteria bacterium]